MPGPPGLYAVGADLVVAVHLLVVAFLLVGGFLAWRWRGLVLVHAPVVLAAALVNLLHLDCPLTSLEASLRRRAGEAVSRDGFLAHYFVRPVHAAGMTPTVALVLRVIPVVIIVVAYGGLVLVQRRRSAGAAHATVVGVSSRTGPTVLV